VTVVDVVEEKLCSLLLEGREFAAVMVDDMGREDEEEDGLTLSL
jgi:hypothetical protein